MQSVDAHGFPLVISDVERPYFESAGAGRLVVQRCTACDYLRYPAGTHCPACGEPGATWTESKGRGRVYSCVIVHHSVRPQFQAPYAVGLVELDDLADVMEPRRMLRILTNIFESDGRTGLSTPVPDATPVEVFFEPLADGLGLPQFKLVAEP
jgi:uncharacterized protein